MSGLYETDGNDVLLLPLGDRAIIVDWGGSIHPDTHAMIRALCSQLERNPVPGIVEAVPAYTTVTIFYEPMALRDPVTGEQWSRRGGKGMRSPFEIIKGIVSRMVKSLEAAEAGRTRIVEIPVCYGGEFGPDLHDVAAHTGLSTEEVIEIHSSQDYLVYMIGFAPGFPYLGGMPERIAVPRRSSPRQIIDPGSVGIGGKQTGVYPIATPGGWQLIGRTPLKLFRPDHAAPSLLQMGDIVRFRPIGPEQYAAWEEDVI
ncbi:5-oxoprolinase subunit PxpB [Paenibacillus apiarius]|uniref:5-oxoprolinase subunit PxpB n=1 Tax=Paenibacillus apiarius TaxID=46240 RepID=A0ABT4DWA6_9BACL|nr:5-oxoprolinase subunit PxpB [Paenibacillus apiarius]MCY9517700.1 5-oxoprolinase subunit PxpB [Paenibacillus apiarius]MCY9521647.1 5-oxoprolinase subunit PxpB [Paenibacillus apiarius]MCY9555325.1 5-oxoprolinase subunit PxpB [Paenibacillus apiarius]MCY9561205.1 5-oxoprolinase subunit PxpB [Paenibacillus apiarius]MCY9686348.1 5-oxoprolinase subunit PxpB [Paenibacillus apiarius]